MAARRTLPASLVVRAAGVAVLAGVSFDPARDVPVALTRYQRLCGDHGMGWIAARPVDPEGRLVAILDWDDLAGRLGTLQSA